MSVKQKETQRKKLLLRARAFRFVANRTEPWSPSLADPDLAGIVDLIRKQLREDSDRMEKRADALGRLIDKQSEGGSAK